MTRTPVKQRLRKPMKCNFVSPKSPAGQCRECGDDAEPGAERLCINCAIEKGMKPVKEPKKSDDSEGQR